MSFSKKTAAIVATKPVQTVRFRKLDSGSVRKAMKAYGISPRRCRKTDSGLQVFVRREDIEKAERFFADFEIVTRFNKPASQINGGEFNSLVGRVG